MFQSVLASLLYTTVKVKLTVISKIPFHPKRTKDLSHTSRDQQVVETSVAYYD